MSIEIVPTGAALGAEIRGVNLARAIDDETFAAIEAPSSTGGPRVRIHLPPAASLLRT
jgi:alpha-ketoglutarate-dependent taurine dioxygenase